MLMVFFIFTGHLSAACITLQQKPQKLLLWLACRKHIGEITLSHMWDALKIETARSPDIELFKRFQKGFDATPHQSTILHTRDAEELEEFTIMQNKKIKLLIANI